ncbi:hypothetical protein IMY97_22290 [Pectobacterium versatile]|nr:hypothetical protein [Pectobacterium versatile]UNE79044.1 hypothetical protein IMY97_22290 [Pectobacterium versatile]
MFKNQPGRYWVGNGWENVIKPGTADILVPRNTLLNEQWCDMLEKEPAGRR